MRPVLSLSRGTGAPEFILVIVMLLVLMLLVGFVLIAPVPSSDASTTSKDILDYRQQVLAVILTAFGAWIGAGAAYYFGRENLAEATKSILEMRGLAPRERLRRQTIRDLKPRPLDWIVEKTTSVGRVWKQLKDETQLWFVPIVDDRGRLVTVIHEEAVYGYVNFKLDALPDKKVREAMEDVNKDSMELVLKYIEERAGREPNWGKRVKDIYVKTTMDTSAGVANDQMGMKGIYLAIVVDQKDRPTHSLTTTDIRLAVLQME